MVTTLTERGQTAVPAAIRKRLGISAGQKLEWVDDGRVIYVHPVPRDPIATFRGSAKGEHLHAALIKARKDDARRR